MKQSDIFSLIMIASIGTLVAFFVCQSIMGDPDEASVKFTQLVKPISKGLSAPDPEVFNSTAINPTVEVYVGDCEDINQNGILDDFELDACGKVQREEKTCFDTDGDGLLNNEELLACEVDLSSPTYADCDVNLDGVLDDNERVTCLIKLDTEAE